jgi:putative FmdB family regulatory protein
MPTYDYSCSACGHRFERFESINDDAIKACLKCGKKKAKRMLGVGAGLIFKGAGFYTTDSKNSGGGPKEPEKKKSEGSEKKSESKEPEKKSESKEKKTGDKEPKK